METMEILEKLNEMYPEAHCQLNHRNNYELAVAVVLSAQTTDASVNRVTPALFEAYPTMSALAAASPAEIKPYIASLGLAQNKARSIHAMAVEVTDRFHGEIPQDMEDLVRLPGVGRKCANVIRAECFGIPSLAVDTHVSRIARRLGFADPDDSVETIEKKLCSAISSEYWIRTHHQMIFFGRERCKARNPRCEDCPFLTICTEKK